jgi:hypothetical protein
MRLPITASNNIIELELLQEAHCHDSIGIRDLSREVLGYNAGTYHLETLTLSHCDVMFTDEIA